MTITMYNINIINIEYMNIPFLTGLFPSMPLNATHCSFNTSPLMAILKQTNARCNALHVIQ